MTCCCASSKKFGRESRGVLLPERISERSSTLKFGGAEGDVGTRCNPSCDVRQGRRPEKVGQGSDTFFVFKGEGRKDGARRFLKRAN